MKWSRPKARWGWIPALALGSLPFLLSGCDQRQPITKPSIEFSIIPQAEEGGPDKLAPIAGRVIGAHTGQQIVLFAKAGMPLKEPVACYGPFVVNKEGEIRQAIEYYQLGRMGGINT